MHAGQNQQRQGIALPRPAREGAPLLAFFADYPFTEQVKIANLGLVGCRLSASQSLLHGLVCTPIRRGLPFARARRHGLRSMSGRYSYGIDNPPTLRRSSFPQRVVRPVGVPKCKTRSGTPRDTHARRAQPPLQSDRPSVTLRAALSAAVRPPLPTRSCDLAGTPLARSERLCRPEAWAKRCL